MSSEIGVGGHADLRRLPNRVSGGSPTPPTHNKTSVPKPSTQTQAHQWRSHQQGHHDGPSSKQTNWKRNLSPQRRSFPILSLPVTFPPGPNHPSWQGKCLRCAMEDHSTENCRNPKLCVNCFQPGHMFRVCPHPPKEASPLTPRGALGDDALPPNHPAKEMKIVCFYTGIEIICLYIHMTRRSEISRCGRIGWIISQKFTK